MPALSHLQKAVLRTLIRTDQPVNRAAFEQALDHDAWIRRNRHRLARLDATLAVMACEGWIRIHDGSVELLAAGRETADAAIS